MITDLLKREFVILDGAIGTLLQKHGLKTGQSSESMCFSNAHIVEKIHRSYIESGSDIIYTNTLCANAEKLKGSGISPAQLIDKAVGIAKSAATGTDTLVALDVGAIGQLMEPYGPLTFDLAYNMFAEQVVAGVKVGADLVVFETFSDLYEVKAAVLAAKENSNLPIFVTMTFDENGRTFTGCDVRAMACTLQGMGVDAVGVNCSLGPKEIYPIVTELARYTSLPIIVKPNAGLPDPTTGEFNVGSDEFAEEMVRFSELGVQIVGGCCGTNPSYISELKKRFENIRRGSQNSQLVTSFCSSTNVVSLDKFCIIGESINPTGKKQVEEALKSGDMTYIEELAVAQTEAGADMLDINVGVPGIDAPSSMVAAIKSVQSVTPLPLVIDSSDPAVLEAALRAYNGKPLVNSVTGEARSLDRILPLVKKYGAAVIGLTLDEHGIPETAEQRVSIARKIMSACIDYGIPKENLIIDTLVLTASTEQKSAIETLRAAKLVKEQLGLSTSLGISNISFGLPKRELVNSTFLTVALSYGIDMAIMNPENTSMMDAIYSYNLLFGSENDTQRYLDYILPRSIVSDAAEVPEFDPSFIEDTSFQEMCGELRKAIIRGLADHASKIAERLLENMTETEIIDECIVPSLDNVSKLYDSGEIFLPQMLKSSDAAGAAFDILRKSLNRKNTSSTSKGRILLATVQGDIHDIGKNIVKAMLENYGYQVIDLGKDVPAEDIVDTAIDQNIHLIGLSALMTTTADNIGTTVAALRERGHNCKVMVGGAVLTEDYARQLGADYYGKDASEALKIAKQFFETR